MGKYDLNQGNIITPVQSTFVDPGVETFKQAALLYRQQYDKNKDAYNLTKRAMAQMELMPGDESAGLRDQFVGNIDKNFEGILETGAFEDATAAVQQNIDYVMTDKTILQAQRNALEFQKEEALIDQFGPSGILDFNKGARESFTTVTTDAEGNEVVNSYKEKMEMKEDYNTYMKNLIGQIAQEGFSNYGVVDVNKDDVIDYLETRNTKGVSQAKMERVVNGLLESYLDSKVGDQDMRRLTQIDGMSEQEARLDILNRMKGAGQHQVGMTPTVSYQQYATNAASGGGGGLFGGEAFDNWAENTMKDSGTNLGFEVFAGMTNSALSDDIPGGVIVTGQQGITLDYTRFIDEGKLAEFNTSLTNEGYTADQAAAVSSNLMEYLSAEHSNDKVAQRRIAADMGIAWDNASERERLQKLSKHAKQYIDEAQLANMGAYMDVRINGVFRPNQGATTNAQWINGNAIVDGEYWFTEEEMNNQATQSGSGHVGSYIWDWQGDDIENRTDAQGNPLYRTQTIDDVTYYIIKGKSKPIAGEAASGTALYKASGHSDSQFNKNEGTLKLQRQAALAIVNTEDAYYMKIVNKLYNPGHELTKVVKTSLQSLKNSQAVLTSDNPVGNYELLAKQIQNIVVNGKSQGKSTDKISQDIAILFDQLNKVQN